VSKFKHAYFIAEIADLWPDTIVDLGVLPRQSTLFKIWKKLELSIYKTADAVVALTPGIAATIQMQSKVKLNLHTICNGYDDTLWHPLEKPKSNQIFKVGYYGAIGRAQSVETLVRAAALIEAEGVLDIKFVVGGSGESLSSLKAIAKALNLKNLEFKQPVPKSAMRSLWNELDLCVVPLRDIELFKGSIPTKLTECFGMELPVLLSSPYSDASKLLEREGFGESVAAENPAILAERIISLSRDTEKIKLFKSNLRMSKGKFTRKVQAFTLYRLILSIMKGI